MQTAIPRLRMKLIVSVATNLGRYKGSIWSGEELGAGRENLILELLFLQIPFRLVLLISEVYHISLQSAIP